MIKLYTWGTPNGNKLHIMLEELGLGYELIPVDLGKSIAPRMAEHGGDRIGSLVGCEIAEPRRSTNRWEAER